MSVSGPSDGSADGVARTEGIINRQPLVGSGLSRLGLEFGVVGIDSERKVELELELGFGIWDSGIAIWDWDWDWDRNWVSHINNTNPSALHSH